MATKCKIIGSLLFLYSALPFICLVDANPESAHADRMKKHFSLFSVVTFKNEECSSQSDFAGGVRSGTCYTATECSDKSGTTSGNCASGFGVCCILLENSGATATIDQNRTYIRNSAYPTISTSTTAATYTINKAQSDICQIRLDFEDFIIVGPANTQESTTTANGHLCNNDNLIITVTSQSTFQAPVLCGMLTGQHLYLDIGKDSTDLATLAFTFAATTTITTALALRRYDVKTSQIPCWASYRAPPGCDQYITEEQGKLTNMNFRILATGATGANMLNTGFELTTQHVKTCMRRGAGMCCVLYELCTQDPDGNTIGDQLIQSGGTANAILGTLNTIIDSWSFSQVTGAQASAIATEGQDQGLVDASCIMDYVEIPSSRTGTCAITAMGASVNSRYCGPIFGAAFPETTTGTTKSMPVCDCSEPFQLIFHTDNYNDNGGVANTGDTSIYTTNMPRKRGFCLDYWQKPCNNSP